MPAKYAPDFEVHTVPYDAGEVVSPSVARALRQTSVHYPNDFLDVDYGLGIKRTLRAQEMLLHSGAANVLSATMKPALVWMLYADYEVCEGGCTRILLGCVDAFSGDFVLASVRYDTLGITTDADASYVGLAFVRKRHWTDMAALLHRFWAHAGMTSTDAAVMPSIFPAQSQLEEPEYRTAINFQEVFHREAVNHVGAFREGLRDIGSGTWRHSSRDEEPWGDESDHWILRGDWAIRMWINDGAEIHGQATDHLRHLFRETVDDVAYQALQSTA